MGGQFSLGMSIGGNPHYNDCGTVDANGIVTLYDCGLNTGQQGDGDFNHGPASTHNEPDVFFRGTLVQLQQSVDYADAYTEASKAFEKLNTKKEPVPCEREPYQTKPWQIDGGSDDALSPDHMKDGQ